MEGYREEVSKRLRLIRDNVDRMLLALQESKDALDKAIGGRDEEEFVGTEECDVLWSVAEEVASANAEVMSALGGLAELEET